MIRLATESDVSSVFEIVDSCEVPNTVIYLHGSGQDRGTLVFDTGPSISPSILGYMCYEAFNNNFVITSLGVFPIYQRQGIGARMVKHFVDSVISMPKCSVYAFVPDSEFIPAKFFASCGFICTGIRGNVRRMFCRHSSQNVKELVINRCQGYIDA